MKKSLIALAVAAAIPMVASAADAKKEAPWKAPAPSVTLGGTINTGIVDTGADGGKVVIGSFGGGANAININAVEQVSKDLSAGARFQMRFKANTGDDGSAAGWSAANALFHDASFFISSKAMGTLRVGKIGEDSNCGFDPWGCATTGGAGLSAPGSSKVITLTGAQTMAEAVKYESPNIGGFTLNYATTINGSYNDNGTDIDNVAALTRDYQRRVVNLTYGNGPVTIQYLKVTGSKAIVGGDGSVPSLADTSIAAAYDLKVAKLMANVVKRKDGTGTIASITAFGAVIPVNAQVTLLAGVAKDSERGGGDDDTTWSLGMNYMLGKNTTLGADVYQAAFNGGTGGTGFVLRGRYSF